MKKGINLTIIIVMLLSSFDVIKLNRMLLDGNSNKVFHIGKSTATIECFWDRMSPENYRIKIATTLEGKKFAVFPDSLKIVSTSPDIEIYPSTTVGIPVTSHKFYTLFGKSSMFISQSIEMVCRPPIDKDSISLSILPSHYILYGDEQLIKDTITVTFSSLDGEK